MGVYWLIQALGHVLVNTHFWVSSLRKTESLGKVRGTRRVKIKYITFKNWIMHSIYSTVSRLFLFVLESIREGQVRVQHGLYYTSKPEYTTPDCTIQDRTTQDCTKQYCTTPDCTTQDCNTQDRATPDCTTQYCTTQYCTTPDRITPDCTTPDRPKSNCTTPDCTIPDHTTPDVTTPVRTTPDNIFNMLHSTVL